MELGIILPFNIAAEIPMVAQNRGEKSKGIKELHGIIICLCLMCQSAYKDLTEKRAQEEKKKKTGT